jgi:hypothetical protein
MHRSDACSIVPTPNQQIIAGSVSAVIAAGIIADGFIVIFFIVQRNLLTGIRLQ